MAFTDSKGKKLWAGIPERGTEEYRDALASAMAKAMKSSGSKEAAQLFEKVFDRDDSPIRKCDLTWKRAAEVMAIETNALIMEASVARRLLRALGAWPLFDAAMVRMGFGVIGDEPGWPAPDPTGADVLAIVPGPEGPQ